MRKLLDADWLRGVQLFYYLYCSTINASKNNWWKGISTNGTALDEIKQSTRWNIKESPKF